MVDQCDVRGCPADALVFVSPDNNSLLSLCGHDFEVRMPDLFAQGFAVIVDNRPALRLAEAERA